MCMRRRDQVELQLFDPEPERTLNRLRREQREAHRRDLEVMQNNEAQDQSQEQNESQGGQNGNNGRNYALKPVIQLITTLIMPIHTLNTPCFEHFLCSNQPN